MATGAYDGGAHLARTGEIAPLALSLLPGARVAQPAEIAAKLVVSGVRNALENSGIGGIFARSHEAGYFPPSKAQRPFEADYARGAPQGDFGSPITHDIDGRPLTARIVAGRRTVGGDDVQLTPSEIADVAEEVSAHVSFGPRSELPRSAVGSFDPVNQSIRVANDLPPDQQAIALAHETGHALDVFGHKANIRTAPR